MSRLIIHVGTHKTATTHIQDTFHKNRELLKQHGVIYPQIGTIRGHHGLTSAWIRLPEPYALQDPGRAWAELVEAHADHDHTVFLSSEEFSRLNPVRVDMASLARLVSRFDEVHILCTLRNQASFLQSVYQQISDERQPAPWQDLTHRALRQRVVDGLALDYNLLYDHLLSGFLPGQIRFISFDDAVRGEGGIVGTFLRELGLTLAEDRLEPFSTARSNVSPPPLATLIANEMSRPDIAPPSLVRRLAGCIDELLPEDSKTTVFSRSEMEQLRDVFAPLNRRFLERISPYQSEFALTETPANASRLFYREQLDDTFWVDVLRRLSR